MEILPAGSRGRAQKPLEAEETLQVVHVREYFVSHVVSTFAKVIIKHQVAYFFGTQCITQY